MQNKALRYQPEDQLCICKLTPLLNGSVGILGYIRSGYIRSEGRRLCLDLELQNLI